MDDTTRPELTCSIRTYDGIRDKRRSVYEVISDTAELQSFIDWLPELEPHEMYYMVLLARNKYCTGLTHIKSDREQLRRVLVTKDYMLDRLKQMECPLGSYKQKDTEIPQEAIAMYINPTPRDMIKGAVNTTKELLEKITGPDQIYNAQSIAMTEIHKAKSRTIFAHFDYDDMEPERWMKQALGVYINPEACTIVKTRGGFHLLVRKDLVSPEFEKKWFTKLVSLIESIVPTGDMIMPIPGCMQGDFTPFFVLKDGVKQ